MALRPIRVQAEFKCPSRPGEPFQERLTLFLSRFLQHEIKATTLLVVRAEGSFLVAVLLHTESMACHQSQLTSPCLLTVRSGAQCFYLVLFQDDKTKTGKQTTSLAESSMKAEINQSGCSQQCPSEAAEDRRGRCTRRQAPPPSTLTAVLHHPAGCRGATCRFDGQVFFL